MREPEYRSVADEPHVLRVVSYNSTSGDHTCVWHEGDARDLTVVIDLMTDCNPSDRPTPESLVGQLVEVDFSYEYSWIACGVKVLNSKGVGRL